MVLAFNRQAQTIDRAAETGRMYGFQLWANLPASHKLMDPRYRDVRHDTVPVVKLESGAVVRLIAGRLGDVIGPVRDVVSEPAYMDISLSAGSELVLPVSPGHTVFAYVIDGAGYFEPGRDAFAHLAVGVSYFDLDVPCLCPNGTLVLYGEGQAIHVTAERQPVRFLLASGMPIGEPIAWYGPIVMNTQKELKAAFEDLEKGTFLRHHPA
jgi:redox-sensitive bicupin YhaK (pirin superfamily)